jgi:sugar phosphate isomerase/epimerase
LLALSTAWHTRRSADPRRTFAAGRRIGFRNFEIGVSSGPLDLRRVARAAERRSVNVSSIHAVCSEDEVPELNRRGDWIGHADDERRRLGVKFARDTVDAARRLGAQAVVLHGGALPVPDASTMQMELFRDVARRGLLDEHGRVVQELARLRQPLVPAHMDALVASLSELCDYAPDVRLGVEDRFFICELPQRNEFQELFDRVDAPNLGYWHDVGHAFVLDRVGYVDQARMLEQYGGRLVGMHLHDIAGFQDHRPPGTGEFNFGLVAEYLRPDIPAVMEIGARHSARAVRRGREHLARMYGIE